MSRRKKRKQGFTGGARPHVRRGTRGESEAQGQGRNGGRWKKIAALAALTVVVLTASLSAVLLLSRSGEPPGPPTAAIVDQLSLTYPNPAFTEQATGMLEKAGYAVDYFPGEVVTVDFYRDLPSQDYNFILLRTHSSLLLSRDDISGQLTALDSVGLFTYELYDEERHFEDQRLSRLVKADYFDGGPKYFGVLAGFFESSARGRFDDTTIVLMGCAGLGNDALAEAFLERGAKEVVGWNRLVSASHTDAATERLLEHLFEDELSVKEAAAQTMAELGPDPLYNSVLLSYPPEG